MMGIETMKNVSSKTVDRSTLVQRSSVRLDPAAPREDRLREFIKQIRNPYCYLDGKTVVKISFAETDTTMKDCLEHRRESDPMRYTPPSGWYYNYPKHKKPAASLERKLNYKGEERLLAKEWYEQQLANYPDVLTVAQVCEVTGYQRHTILKWCSKGLLKAILQTPKYMIPKVWLLEFVTSDFFNEISRKCGKHYAAIKEIGGSRKAR